jgi:hypothetical protein
MRAQGMGRNKDLRAKTAGEERSRINHERKLQLESAKPAPDSELIEFWRREINAATKRIARLTRRLERNW